MRLNARFASAVAASCVGAAVLGHPERVKGILVAGLPGAALMCHLVHWRMRVTYRAVRRDAERTLAASSRPRHTAERLRESYYRSLGAAVPDRPVFLLTDYAARKAGSPTPPELGHDGDDAGSRAHDPGRGAAVDRTQTANGVNAVRMNELSRREVPAEAVPIRYVTPPQGPPRVITVAPKSNRLFKAWVFVRAIFAAIGFATCAALAAGFASAELKERRARGVPPFPAEADRASEAQQARWLDAQMKYHNDFQRALHEKR